MKVFLIFGLVSTIFAAYLLQDVLASPVYVTTYAPKHSQNCMFILDQETQISNAWLECNNQTGFLGNSTENSTISFDEILISKEYQDDCFGKCFLQKLDWFHQNGSLKMNMGDLLKTFKSNAPAKIESKRMDEWKDCAEDLKKRTKDNLKKLQKNKLSRGANGDETSCVAAAKFLACGIKAEKHVVKKCNSKQKAY